MAERLPVAIRFMLVQLFERRRKRVRAVDSALCAVAPSLRVLSQTELSNRVCSYGGINAIPGNHRRLSRPHLGGSEDTGCCGSRPFSRTSAGLSNHRGAQCDRYELGTTMTVALLLARVIELTSRLVSRTSRRARICSRLSHVRTEVKIPTRRN